MSNVGHSPKAAEKMQVADVSTEQSMMGVFASSRKDSVTEKCLAQSNGPRPLASALEVKSREVELQTKEVIGSSWLAMLLWNAVKDWNRACMEAMESHRIRVLLNVWVLLFLSASLLFHICFLRSLADQVGTTYIIAAFISIFNVLYVIFAAVEFCLHLKHSHNHEGLWIAYCWVQCLYSGLCLFNFVAFLAEEDYMSWLYLGLIYFANLPYSTNVILWSMMSPLLVTFLLAEFAIRLVACRLSCPHSVNTRRQHVYGVYAFNEVLGEAATECVICLRPFTAESRDICVSTCGTKHIFHESCIFEWLKVCPYCPMCRSEIKFYAT